MSAKRIITCVFLPLVLISSGHAIADEYMLQRQRLIAEIEGDVQVTTKHIKQKSLDKRVMRIMSEIPRHEFVPEDMRELAYENRPLSIGYGQTISQPYIVALMTDLLQPQPEHRVLEIGTGSGYQAAVLSRLVDQVYSIEIIKKLGKSTAQLLKKLDYDNIEVRISDGDDG